MCLWLNSRACFYGFDVYTFLHTGLTALMIAAKEGNAVLVQILIGASAILDFKEKEVYIH